MICGTNARNPAKDIWNIRSDNRSILRVLCGELCPKVSMFYRSVHSLNYFVVTSYVVNISLLSRARMLPHDYTRIQLRVECYIT